MKSQIIAFQPTAMTEQEVRKEVQIHFGKKIKVGIIGQENVKALKTLASPSAAVINSLGTVLYFGPYSSDAYCSTDKESFVESAVIKAKNNATEKRAGVLLTSGCLCSWSEESISRRYRQQ